METALYYTLSTVSQTLAGALGMLAAFLALRVAALDSTINSELTDLERWTQTQAGAMRPRSGSVIDRLHGWRKRFGPGDFESDDGKVGMLLRAEESYQSRTVLLGQARSAFVASAVVMGSCFVGLALAPWLGCVALRGGSAAAVAIIGGVLCLVWYGRIVGTALK